MPEMKTTIEPDDVLLRLPGVLKRVPVSRTQLYDMIREGNFPKPLKIGQTISAWSSRQIDQVMQSWKRDSDQR